MPREGQAALLAPAGADGPHFLVTRNFKVIKAYNNSTSYALGVALLGDRIAGAEPPARQLADWRSDSADVFLTQPTTAGG